MSYNIYLNVIKMIIKPEYRNMTLENTNIIDEKTYIFFGKTKNLWILGKNIDTES